MVWSHSVFRDSGLAQLVVGPAGRINVANPAALALFGRNSLAGTDLADLIAAPERPSLDAFLAMLSALAAGRSEGLGPVHPVNRPQDHPIQMIGSRTDGAGGFDALVVAVHELPATPATDPDPIAMVDPLTGVGTRARGLLALERAVRTDASGCLLIVDLDGFGWINESFGYAEGDRILVEAAQRLQRSVPPGATVARIDGDQFLLISPGTPLAGSLQLGKDVLAALARPMHIAGTRVVTVSIGTAGLAGPSADEVLAHAQTALAVAKQQGGHQVVVDGPAMGPHAHQHSDASSALSDLVADAHQARLDLAQAQEEAALAQTAADLAHLEARTCPVTGLPNIRAFTEGAARVQAEAHRSGRPAAVVFLDLDRFGTINKAISWAQGTQTLTAVAQVLESECRGQDQVFRYGGEEFVVLLPGTDLAGARTVAERMRAAVEAAQIPHNGLPEVPIVTLSVGVAAGSWPQLVIADLVTEADRLSQHAKTIGRNRVLTADDITRSGGDAA